jgi:hypothetical protein
MGRAAVHRHFSISQRTLIDVSLPHPAGAVQGPKPAVSIFLSEALLVEVRTMIVVVGKFELDMV